MRDHHTIKNVDSDSSAIALVDLVHPSQDAIREGESLNISIILGVFEAHRGVLAAHPEQALPFA